ncbi:MAG: nuclear transport factor 2 family protein [Acidobacteria bacterium]|nr:nuclear transport factor 2 family protein [Acidobacteriota bacterium]MCL5286449.1 nuclear transport factor 2 family protein [Acidobacteriota bacterium]
MMYRPFRWPRQALLATALALFWFHPPSHSVILSEAKDLSVSQAPAQTGAITEIRALFAEFLKLHAAKKMDEWRDKVFLPEAICVRTAPDGEVAVFPVAELARIIAEEAKSLDEQHEEFEDVRIEVYGNAAHYATSWTLFHNGKVARKGRAFFSLVKKEGAWRIASLVWYRE